MTTLINTIVIGNVAAFIIVTGVVLGLILKKQHCRGDTTSEPPRLQITEYQELKRMKTPAAQQNYLLPVVVISVLIFIIITGAILGFIHRKQRRRQEFQTSRPNMEPQNTDQYSTFIERENELYSLATPYVFTRED
ncbi:hypothetical protein L3Q82_000783 [Scortum barcoo]|uniref:Uncharacterized protein n=1 Tax=Scortum barcoo TaxID=214431 RepID=A0ACB8WDM3_9TELE|nr:hypothetical protein L3Q82_000783 [Scortum barcoo]